MKKSVIILIGIIYISAIALVSFFGLDFKVFEPVVYSERIELLNEGLKENSKGGKYIVIQPGSDGSLQFQIEHRVYPDDVTNNTVTYSTDNPNVTISDSGLVTFNKPGAATIIITANDGTGAKASLTIYAVKTS